MVGPFRALYARLGVCREVAGSPSTCTVIRYRSIQHDTKAERQTSLWVRMVRTVPNRVVRPVEARSLRVYRH